MVCGILRELFCSRSTSVTLPIHKYSMRAEAVSPGYILAYGKRTSRFLRWWLVPVRTQKFAALISYPMLNFIMAAMRVHRSKGWWQDYLLAQPQTPKRRSKLQIGRAWRVSSTLGSHTRDIYPWRLTFSTTMYRCVAMSTDSQFGN